MYTDSLLWLVHSFRPDRGDYDHREWQDEAKQRRQPPPPPPHTADGPGGPPPNDTWYRDDWLEGPGGPPGGYGYRSEVDDRYIRRLRSPSPERPRWTDRHLLYNRQVHFATI